MIVVILYTLILLFIDRTTASTLCMQALKQWYEAMIPALLPMMLVSSIMVDTGFAQKIGKIINRFLLPFLHITDCGCYCLLAGFLFGFPMGAKTISDMCIHKKMSPKEANYLLCFINCIGPMYTINLIHKLFPTHSLYALCLGIYGIPLFYGILLRYTIYRKENFHLSDFIGSNQAYKDFSDALYECVPKCCHSILMLGGYMVLFQISFLTLNHFLESINLITTRCYPLLEITGGLFLLPQDISLPWVLFYATFGGACCMIQTYSFLKTAGLSMANYALHKAILSAFSFLIGMLL